jgi:hypothetical protein
MLYSFDLYICGRCSFGLLVVVISLGVLLDIYSRVSMGSCTVKTRVLEVITTSLGHSSMEVQCRIPGLPPHTKKNLPNY